MAKVLIVEDDKDLAATAAEALQGANHTVEHAHFGQLAVDLLEVAKFDLIILDWDLPDITGLELCRSYRGRGGKAPILFLTGKSSLFDKELAFDSGSDDYLTKPFQMRELLMRVRALLRRPPELKNDVLSARDIELDTARHAVFKAGEPVKLYPKDFAVLEFLLRHPNSVFSAEEILKHVWSSDSNGSVDVVRQCLMRLRKTFDYGADNALIKNVHGVGYRLDP